MLVEHGQERIKLEEPNPGRNGLSARGISQLRRKRYEKLGKEALCRPS
jgi:hypothetical protein